MVTRKILTYHTRELLRDGNWVRAVIRSSSDLEDNLFNKLFLEKKIDPQKIERTPLSELVKKCKRLGVIRGNQKLLEDFVHFRNRVIHERAFVDQVDQSEEARKYAVGLIEKILKYNTTFLVKSTMLQEEKNNSYQEQKRDQILLNQKNNGSKWYQ